MSSQVSRPVLIGLLVTVLFAGVWFVALRPKSDSSTSAAATPAATTPGAAPAASATPGGPSAPGVTGLKHAIDKAHGAVATSQQQAQQLQAQTQAASGGSAPAGGAPGGGASGAAAAKPSATAAVPTASGSHAGTPAKATAAAAHGIARTVASVQRALDAHKVLVFLFYNPRGLDDRTMHSELKHVGRHHGTVAVLSAPIAQLAKFKAITARTEVDGSPTLLFFDKHGHVAALHGFADPAEVNQRVLDVIKSGVGG